VLRIIDQFIEAPHRRDAAVATTERLAKLLFRADDEATRSRLLVAESGIHSRRDVERLMACGSEAILVGESLMKSGNIADKVAELIDA
jgi:indole-3-glycerol phosphate synthase